MMWIQLNLTISVMLCMRGSNASFYMCSEKFLQVQMNLAISVHCVKGTRASLLVCGEQFVWVQMNIASSRHCLVGVCASYSACTEQFISVPINLVINVVQCTRCNSASSSRCCE